MAKKGAHSRGAAGLFKRALQNVTSLKGPDGAIHEHQVGPGNIKPIGCGKKTNYKGSTGASFLGIRKAIQAAKTEQIQVAFLYRCESGSYKNPSFQWYQTETRSKDGTLDALIFADLHGYTVAEFASALVVSDFPFLLVPTWRVIEVHGT